MDILKIIKTKKTFYLELFLKETDEKQKIKYVHFYESYHILYNELLNSKNNNE